MTNLDRCYNIFDLREVAPNTTQWFASFMKSETTKWAKVVKASGATAD